MSFKYFFGRDFFDRHYSVTVNSRDAHFLADSHENHWRKCKFLVTNCQIDWFRILFFFNQKYPEHGSVHESIVIFSQKYLRIDSNRSILFSRNEIFSQPKLSSLCQSHAKKWNCSSVQQLVIVLLPERYKKTIEWHRELRLFWVL